MSASENAETNEFFAAWWDVFRNQRVTPRQVILTALEGGAPASALRSRLAELAPSEYPGTFSAHKLGRWLVRHADAVLVTETARLRLVDRGTDRQYRVWQLLPEEALEDAG